MARRYSDIFKFQTAYSQGKINLALSIIPKSGLAVGIDQNAANFERAMRELSCAKLSTTLPILLPGLYSDDGTEIVDLREWNFSSQRQITANSNEAKENRFRIVNGFLNGTGMRDRNSQSETGPMPDDTE